MNVTIDWGFGSLVDKVLESVTLWTRTGTWGMDTADPAVVSVLLSGYLVRLWFIEIQTSISVVLFLALQNQYLNCPTHNLTKVAASGRRSDETETGELSCLWLIARAIHQHRSGVNELSTYLASQTANPAQNK